MTTKVGQQLQKNDQWVFDTVADMKAAKLRVGDSAKTLGYYAVNDGGEGEYVIVATATGTDDGGSYHDLNNGLQAELLVGSYINARHFGVSHTVVDNAPYITNLLAFAATRQLPIDWTYGAIYTNSPNTVSNQIGMFSSGNAVIIATYEQVDAAGVINNSLFAISNSDGFFARDFNLKYNGTFDEGLNGEVCGLYITDSNNVTVENIKAEDFNHSACSIGFEGGDCLEPIITNCRFETCRLAGAFVGNSDGALVSNNLFKENGLLGDSGTGYGVAFLSGTSVKNCIVTGNKTYKNARRGIDLHSHQTAIVANNICYKDVICGIYAITRGNAARTLTVSNNTVFCDDQSVNGVELAYTGIQLGVSGIIPTSGGVPTIIETGNSIFNLSKDLVATGIAAESVVGLSFVNGIATGEPMEILSYGSQLRGVDFKPIVAQFTSGDTTDIRINNHVIKGNDLYDIVQLLGEGSNNGQREVTELDVRANSVIGEKVEITGGYDYVRIESNRLNGAFFDSVIISTVGNKKIYHRKASLAASTPTLVFDAFDKGEVGVFKMFYHIYSNDGTHIDIAGGTGTILAGWDSNLNANIVPIYTPSSEAARASYSAGVGVSGLNTVIGVDRNETFGNFRALELSFTVDKAADLYLELEVLGSNVSISV